MTNTPSTKARCPAGKTPQTKSATTPTNVNLMSCGKRNPAVQRDSRIARVFMPLKGDRICLRTGSCLRRSQGHRRPPTCEGVAQDRMGDSCEQCDRLRPPEASPKLQGHPLNRSLWIAPRPESPHRPEPLAPRNPPVESSRGAASTQPRSWAGQRGWQERAVSGCKAPRWAFLDPQPKRSQPPRRGTPAARAPWRAAH